MDLTSPMKPRAWAERWSSLPSAVLGRLSPALILWLASGSLTAIFLIFGLTLGEARRDVGAAAATASTNLLAAVSQQIGREIEILDMSLLDLRDAAQRDDVGTLASELRQSVLFDRPASARGLGALIELDASGHVVEEAGVTAPPRIDLSAQSLFTVHQFGEVGLFISPPFVSLVDGEPSIALSRRIVRAGRFAGVAVATIKLSHFKEMFAELDLGPAGMMSLFSTDGTILMRQPFLQAATGQSRNLVSTLGVNGSFDATSPYDGVDRRYFYQRLGRLPLILFVGRATSDIYFLWWVRTALTSFAMFLLGNTILLLIVALQGELRRRRAAEAALAILATTDKLTGLANRRKFDEALDAEWARARLDCHPLALLLVDADHFKTLNDHIGHQGGDAVLAALGACLNQIAAGQPGLAARYGGEEFVLLLPGLDLPAACAIAEELRRRVVALALPHPQGKGGRLTVSIGVADAWPAVISTPADLLRAADLALYEAKKAGRDRVEPSLSQTLAA